MKSGTHSLVFLAASGLGPRIGRVARGGAGQRRYRRHRLAHREKRVHQRRSDPGDRPRKRKAAGQVQLADVLRIDPRRRRDRSRSPRPISNRFVANGGNDVQTVSLRGLGAERTLVLINGRRAGPRRHPRVWSRRSTSTCCRCRWCAGRGAQDRCLVDLWLRTRSRAWSIS